MKILDGHLPVFPSPRGWELCLPFLVWFSFVNDANLFHLGDLCFPQDKPLTPWQFQAKLTELSSSVSSIVWDHIFTRSPWRKIIHYNGNTAWWCCINYVNIQREGEGRGMSCWVRQPKSVQMDNFLSNFWICGSVYWREDYKLRFWPWFIQISKMQLEKQRKQKHGTKEIPW